MLDDEVLFAVSQAPPGFRRDYDAHVYFANADQLQVAQMLREKALSEFRGLPILVGPLVQRSVGPHPLPMFEINFSRDYFMEICDWLNERRGALSILVHQVTGFDLRDHTSGAVWLGQPVPLDHSKLNPDPSTDEFKNG